MSKSKRALIYEAVAIFTRYGNSEANKLLLLDDIVAAGRKAKKTESEIVYDVAKHIAGQTFLALNDHKGNWLMLIRYGVWQSVKVPHKKSRIEHKNDAIWISKKATNKEIRDAITAKHPGWMIHGYVLPKDSAAYTGE